MPPLFWAPPRGATGRLQFSASVSITHLLYIKQAMSANSSSPAAHQNLVNTRFLMQKHHLHDIVIISDPLHIARAMAIAKDLDIKANYSPTPTSRYHNASWQTQAAFFIQESYALFIYHLLHFGRSISKMII